MTVSRPPRRGEAGERGTDRSDHGGAPGRPTLDRLLSLVGSGDLQAAADHFRRAIVSGPLEPALQSWIEAGWHAFAPFAPHGLLTEIEAVRSGLRPCDLLFGQILFGAGFRAEAIAFVRALEHCEPSTAAPFVMCCMLLKHRNPAAQDHLRHCLATRPGPDAGWSLIGRALGDLGQREAALICFARAPQTFDVLMERGLLARDLGRPAEARACFADAVKRDGSSVRAWFLLGAAAQDSGDSGGAVEAYRTVLVLDPARAEAAVNLGTVLQDSGDLAAAKQAYARAVAMRGDTFGRVAQALATSRRGELWLDLAALRRSLSA